MKKAKFATIALTGFGLTLMQGCSHAALEKRLDDKVAQEPPISSSQELRHEAAGMIGVIPHLTDDQRARLVSLQQETTDQVDSLKEQSLRLRSILIKDLVSANYDDAEVELAKKRLRETEDSRLSAIFSAIEKANTILGHQTQESSKMLAGFFEGPTHNN